MFVMEVRRMARSIQLISLNKNKEFDKSSTSNFSVQDEMRAELSKYDFKQECLSYV